MAWYLSASYDARAAPWRVLARTAGSATVRGIKRSRRDVAATTHTAKCKSRITPVLNLETMESDQKAG